jgi:hypothetical protein
VVQAKGPAVGVSAQSETRTATRPPSFSRGRIRPCPHCSTHSQHLSGQPRAKSARPSMAVPARPPRCHNCRDRCAHGNAEPAVPPARASHARAAKETTPRTTHAQSHPPRWLRGRKRPPRRRHLPSASSAYRVTRHAAHAATRAAATDYRSSPRRTRGRLGGRSGPLRLDAGDGVTRAPSGGGTHAQCAQGDDDGARDGCGQAGSEERSLDVRRRAPERLRDHVAGRCAHDGERRLVEHARGRGRGARDSRYSTAGTRRACARERRDQ